MSNKTAADVADNVVNKISDVAQAMADAFKKLAPHVWEVMVRQQVLEGVTNVALFLVVLVLFILSCVYLKKSYAKHGCFFSDERDCFTPAVGALILSIAVAIGVICKANDLPENVTKIINPEYYAAYELLDTVKN